MQKVGIPCPRVVLLKKHILVMSFIGKDQKPAPKLKDAVLSSNQFEKAYQQCVEVTSSVLRFNISYFVYWPTRTCRFFVFRAIFFARIDLQMGWHIVWFTMYQDQT